MFVVKHRIIVSAVALSLFAPATAAARYDINPTPPTAQAAAPVVRVADPNTFAYDDAGIGAVGGIVLSALALIGGRAVRDREPAV